VAAVFLGDGAQDAEGVSGLIIDFLAEATSTLEIALYDIRLSGRAAAGVSQAMASARARGVQIRVVFNVDHAKPRPVPPPPAVDWDMVKTWDVPFHPISGVPDLMHHKYVVRDADSPAASVLTGSTNWTNDSWTREENILLRIQSQALASIFRQNFEELWLTRDVARSGHQSPVWVDLAQGLRARPYFTPGRAEKMVHEISQALATARRRVRVCSPVITSGPILATLCEVAAKGEVEIKGVYDATQMAEVHSQWSENPGSAWKIAAFDTLISQVPLGAKISTPWQPGSVHDFMHAKAVVTDDRVFTGSYNLSHSGEENAENVIEIEHAGLAGMFAGFIERVAARYGPAPTPR
jgi:phosphatidylserine/phosphatidylglycerophosphate/cardiolipin synthase-like enzyme